MIGPRARLNKQSHDYELMADGLDNTGVAQAPRQNSEGVASSMEFAFGSVPQAKLRLFRRMLAWRPAAVEAQTDSISSVMAQRSQEGSQDAEVDRIIALTGISFRKF